MALSEATSGAAMPSSLPRWRHKATGITRKAPSKRPLMRRKPIWSARPSLWESPRRALIASRSAPSKVKNAFISKSLISRGSPRIPKNVVCQPCIVNLKSGRPPYPFTKRTGKSMKSTVYPDHPRASASFAYRHLLHRKRGDPYWPNKEFARHELAAWGIGHRLYDPMDPASVAAALSPEVKLVWLEAPGSVTLEFPDLAGLVRLARAQAPQALLALDNTWGAGIAFDAFALGAGEGASPLGVDLTVHALTKYPSGGGDVLMGSIACRDEALHQRLAWCHSRLGLGVGANDVEAVLRGLPTLALRYAAQDAAARRIADWAAGHPAVRRVLHPARADSP